MIISVKPLFIWAALLFGMEVKYDKSVEVCN